MASPAITSRWPPGGQKTSPVDRCPNHPHGECSLARHGTYARKTPRGTQIARWYCPESHTTFSLLPDCLAARLPGELDTLEAVVAHAERAPSRSAAANALRREGSVLRAVTFVRGCVTGEGECRAGGHRRSTVMGWGFTMRPGSGMVIENSVPSGVRHRLAGHAQTARAAEEHAGGRHRGPLPPPGHAPALHRRPRRASPDQPVDGRTRRAATRLVAERAAGRRHAASQAGATADAGGGGPTARCFEPR